MTLPAPNLDDRRFQQLVDDAKRMVQQRCPEWTDHNVSDPGVTLIETFAFMVDQLVYRLNRVPDRNFITFLDLVGITLFPPTAATTDVTFWLSAPLPDTLTVPAGTKVATTPGGGSETLTFTTVEERPIVTAALEAVGSSIAEGPLRDHGEELAGGREFACFGGEPAPGDALYLGLTAAVPGCAVRLALGCRIEGVGVDPRNPPLVWEAWTGDAWTACQVEVDTTGGLNRDGEVVVHVPRGHLVHVMAQQRAGWIRCRVVDPLEGQPFYAASPHITRVAAATVGGTAQAVHAELVDDEILGLSEGVPGQRFPVRRQPVVPAPEPEVVEVAAGDGWETWSAVDSFAESGPEDTHFRLDRVSGDVCFGPGVRLPDGRLRRYGAVPPKGAPLRLRRYRTGGGRAGNVAAGAITALESSIPFVDRVGNRLAASGGVDGETLDNAKVRGPLALRARGRAVTAEDFELLAREAAPEVARVRCAPAGSDDEATNAIRVLVVPTVTEDEDRLRFEELLPEDDTLERIAAYLDERRLIGARVMVEPPVYQGLTVVARLRAKNRTSPLRLQADAIDALHAYFHPTRGGPDGTGWPFGRPVNVGEVYSTLQRLPGIDYVEEATLFPADPVTGARSAPVQRLEISEHALVFGYQHSILVEE